MRYGFVLISTLFIAFSSCKKEKEPVTPPHSVPEEPPIAVALLKDITIPNLPSPYYHFEYTASGTASFASFASGFNQYNLVYSNGRIHQMRNNIVVNKDTIQYLYDNANRVDRINYIAEGGNVYVKISLTYDAQKLIKIDREKKLGNIFILDKTMTMSYHADGNLKDLTYHYFPFNESAEHIFTDHFDQYDSKVNVDAFGLLHNEFFDHLVLLPGVQLQKNNPLKESRTGDAANYNITYTYTYNDKNHPVNKKGDLVFTTGTDTGKRFQTNSFYSYY